MPAPMAITTSPIKQHQQPQQPQPPQTPTKATTTSTTSTTNPTTDKLSELYRMSEDQSWSIRKQGITEVFIPLISNEKMASSLSHQDYQRISSTLAKLLGDSNIFVILTCINAIELLAKRLSKDTFNNYITPLFPTMLDSFKEKRPQLSDSIHACLNTIMEKQLSIKDVLDPILNVLGNNTHKQASKLKLETMIWLKRMILSPTSQGYRDKLPEIIKALVLVLDDPLKETRDIALVNLCTLMVIYGEKDVLPLLEPILDGTKIASIREGTKDVVIPLTHWSRPKKGATLSRGSMASVSPRASLNISASRQQNTPTTATDGHDQSRRMLKDMQSEMDEYSQRMSEKMRQLMRTMEDEYASLQDRIMQGTQGDANVPHTSHAESDSSFYETLNMELTKELQSEKDKKKELICRVQTLEQQVADIQQMCHALTDEKMRLQETMIKQSEEIDELNEMIDSDEQMQQDLLDEIERLKGSTITVGSFNDPNRYLVELPKNIIDMLPPDELELFEEVYQANVRIIQEAKERL
ncbi:hypothetical protein SAMD00019534_115510 [Acytostelium subglobosum LB1]|uniref:hypothetical protein n=1 Tax=Acytostelium subglobosum LB1 TaxID=1410327 RepID=UPI000644BEA0|nr:hypothetical protein SAMD00019534_115510 [Acytostelium subglobosum LB1]GAM28375.1 hypothetical protein SAMD00019534_115510 [Acytostelium subglobosum LB1]|eukprot:XP_012748692.1 hypothetical protein SAMD00019534_115510 [Acytostelium subglobosum LB1]